MIEVYSWPTPNGDKVHIALEELGLDYEVHPIDIGAGDQFTPEFLAVSPNNKIPAIVDRDGPGGQPLALFESGAILWYLAEKTGRLLPPDPVGRLRTMEWLMWQMGSIGPMLGQNHHFRRYAPQRIPYAVDRYTNEAQRLYRVLDERLAKHPFVTGDTYTIADIAIFPWTRGHEIKGVDIEPLANYRRWHRAIRDRPAVERGLQVLRDKKTSITTGSRAHEILFRASQYQSRKPPSVD